MAIRSPIVMGADGLPQGLQPGDTVGAPTNAPSVRAVTNGDSVALVFGMPVYASGAGVVKRAQANAKATARVAGLWFDASTAGGAVGNVAQSGVLVGTAAQWDAVAGTTGGLTFNSIYFLDPANPGKLTTIPPTTSGQCNTLIGMGLSTTELSLDTEQPILL